MKKVFLFLACVGMFFDISAQELQTAQISMPKHEIYAGFGLLNDNQILAMATDIVGTIVTLGYLVRPGSYRAFTPFMGYRYWFSKHFGLGGIFAFDYNSVKVYNGTDPKDQSVQMREINRYYMTFAVEPTFNYVYKPAWQLYGYLGLGGTIVTFADATFNDGTKAIISRLPYVNVHFTPIGMRFGKEFGGFLEFGYGYKGILNAGFSYRF